MSGQFHSTATLTPRQVVPVPTEQGAAWVLEISWAIWTRKLSLIHLKSKHGPLVSQPTHLYKCRGNGDKFGMFVNVMWTVMLNFFDISFKQEWLLRITEGCRSILVNINLINNVYINQRDATLLMNDLYYSLFGSTCFGLSPVHHQEHHLINCITHWYLRAIRRV